MQVQQTVDGHTYYVHNGRRHYVWADCWRCGARQLPAVSWHTLRGGQQAAVVERLLAGWTGWRHTRTLIGCGACGATVPVLVIDQTRRHDGTPERCGGACLSGKRTCNCKCNGRCHGAGRCSCGS